jgi:ubiquitin-protein ligase
MHQTKDQGGKGIQQQQSCHQQEEQRQYSLLLSPPPPSNKFQQLLKDCLTPDYRGLMNSENNNNNNSNLHTSPPRVPFSLQEEREQALRDYKVTIEYKHLKSHAPGGVYLIPSMDNLRHFYGVIFVRRGPYTNGIFKFSLKLPPKYNDTNMWPEMIFSSHVFSPYVNEETGQLDIQSAYPTWDPSRHYLVTVLTYLKKIFYSKNFTDAKANLQAKQLAETNAEAYRKKVDECVRESQKNVYVNDEKSTATFTEEAVSHRVLRDLLKHHIRNENQVTKQAVLTQIEKARKV